MNVFVVVGGLQVRLMIASLITWKVACNSSVFEKHMRVLLYFYKLKLICTRTNF